MPYCALVVADEEAQKLSVPPEVEANEVAKIFGLLKVYIPREIELDGLSGKELFGGMRNLEEELASDLVHLNPYMKKRSLVRTQKSNTLEECGNPIHPHTCFHLFCWCNMYLNLLVTDKAKEETTFLPPLPMATLANQSPQPLVLANPVLTRDPCSLWSCLATHKPHWQPQW